MSKETIEGSKSDFITAREESCPWIHNIVVVTSPIGVHAPPAFAATTTKQHKRKRSARCGIILRKRETIKIVVVKLSSTAERTKERQDTSHNIFFFEEGLMRSVMILNPRCASISSTRVMAPIKKK